ncbi:MAG: GGDEF domain-containing protein [Thermoleophilia bacterium]|nr:GGDEF domain-containing protein [Thermoleophilia bacterium]
MSTVAVLRAFPHAARRGLADWSPRGPEAAVRSATVLFVAAGVIIAARCVATLAIFGTLESDGTSTTGPVGLWLNTVVVPVVLVGLGIWTHHAGPRASWAVGWPLTLGSLGLLLAVNLANHDPSAGPLMFALLPTIYAAYQLRPWPAAMAAAAASVSAIVTTVVTRPGGLRESGVVYFVITIACLVTMIIRAREAAADTEAELERMAMSDGLTGLASRLTLDAEASRLLPAAGAPVSLAIIDVDRFRAINDRLGHPGGDATLKRVADHLRTHARATDTVCRLGGDEFVLLMPGCGAEDALSRTEGIVRGARDAVRGDDEAGAAAFTLSAGVATAPDDGADLTALVAAADRRLYHAKGGGRDRVGSE